MKLKILFVTKYISGSLPKEFTYHGEWTDSYELILALKKVYPKLKIYLLTPKIRKEHFKRFNQEFGEILKENNIQHYFIDAYLDYGMPSTLLRWEFFKKEKELIQKLNINIIHYNQFQPNCCYAFKKQLRLKKIICYGCYGEKKEGEWRKKDKKYKNKLCKTNTVTKVKRMIKKLPLQLFFRFLRLKTFDKRVDYFVLKNPKGYELMKQKFKDLNIIYIPKGQTNPLKIKIKVLEKIKNILFIGNLYYGKGIIDLLKITEMFPDIKFNIIGTGNSEIKKEIQKIAQKNKNINFLGSVSYYEKWHAYLQNDLLLHPSYSDAFPSVILEALSCGLPVITTYEIDSPIKDGENGFLYHAGNLNELKKKLNFIQHNINIYYQMSKKALETAQRYTWENAAKKFLDIYFE